MILLIRCESERMTQNGLQINLDGAKLGCVQHSIKNIYIYIESSKLGCVYRSIKKENI